jgi:hypothetical protein
MKFPWGKVIQGFVVDFDGDLMEVTKYHPWIYKNNQSTCVANSDEVSYHCEEISESSESLDQLVISWIVYRRLGLNQRPLVAGICRALKI